MSKQSSLKQAYQTLERHGLDKQNTVTTTFAGLKIISANDRDFTHVIEENEEPESGEDSGLGKEDDKDCNPFAEIDDFIGLDSKKDNKTKMFDMGDDIHNLCDTPGPPTKASHETIHKDALPDLPMQSEILESDEVSFPKKRI